MTEPPPRGRVREVPGVRIVDAPDPQAHEVRLPC